MAVGRSGDRVVARDAVTTAGRPYALRLRPDRHVVHDLAYVTAEVVDRHGTVVPYADDRVAYRVAGGRIAGLDNGREEDPEGFKGHAHTAFNGLGLAIVQPRPGARQMRVTASAPGLRPASATLLARGPGAAHGAPPQRVPRLAKPAVDASYSGAQDTVPAAMVDGDMSSGWSNLYSTPATALLPSISVPHPREWVSFAWPRARKLTTLTAYFTVDAMHRLPTGLTVRYWNGARYVPVGGQHIEWAAGSNQPTTITFDAVRTRSVKLDMEATSFLQIAEVQFP